MAFITAGVFGAFVSVAVAWAARNRDVSAVPVQADIVRTGVIVIIAKVDTWIGKMSA